MAPSKGVESKSSSILIFDAPHAVTDDLAEILRSDISYAASKPETALKHTIPDLILCASALAPKIIPLAQKLQPQTPLILVSDQADPQHTLEMMRLGAQDFVERTDKPRLIQRVKSALETRRLAAAFQDTETRYQSIVDNQTELLCRYDSDFRLTFVNRAYCEWRGQPPEVLLGWSFIENIPQAEREQTVATIKALTAENPIVISCHQSEMPDGTYRLIEWTDRALFDADGRLIEYQGTGRDITEQERQAQQLRAMKTELEAQRDALNSVLNTMQDAVISLSAPDRQLIFASTSFEQVFGYPAESFLKDAEFYNQVIHPDDVSKAREAWETCVQNGSVEFEHRIILPNGDVRWLHRHRWFSFGEDGAIIRVNDSARDITERKNAEIALRNREENLRTLFDTIDDFLFVLDMQGNIQSVNDTVLQRLGFSWEELHHQSLLMVHPQEHHAEVIQSVHEIAQGKRNYCAIPIQSKYGALIPVETYVTQGMWDGQPALFGVSKDVSALKMSEAKFAAAFHENPAMIILSNAETGECIEVNETFCEKLGFTASEVIGKQTADLLHGQPLMDKLKNRQGIRNEETSICTRDGRHLSVLLSAEVIHPNNTPYNVITAVDITERRQMEEALRASEEKYRSLLESADAIILTYDVTGKVLYGNEIAANQLHLTPETLVGKTIDEILPPEIAAAQLASVQQVINTGTGFVREAPEFVHNETRWYRTSIQPIRDASGNVTAALVNATNITEKKQAEVALQKSFDLLEQRVAERTAELERTKNRLEAIFNHSGDGILLLDLHRGIQQTNYAFDAMFNISDDRSIGAPLSAFFQQAEVIANTVYEVAATHQTRQIEARAKRADGSMFDVEISIAPVNRSMNAVNNLVCIIRDITERKTAENALKRYTDEIQDLYNRAPIGYHSVAPDETIIQINDTELRWLGYTREQVIGKLKFSDLLTDEGKRTVRKTFPMLREQGWVKDLEFEIKRKDGSTFWVLLSATAIYDEAGHFVQSRSTMYDISARKQAEIALRESEERYRTTITAMSEGILMLDEDGKVRICNAAAERILGLTAEQIMGRTSVDSGWRTIYENGDPFPLAQQPAMVTLRTGEPLSDVVMGIHRPGGELRWISVNTQAVINAGDTKPAGAVATLSDITERKKAEAALEQKLQDETVMQGYLRALHEASIELARATSLDRFYKMTVEIGLRRFGFERIGLLIYDAETETAVGTYGTDANGNVCDEHHIRVPLEQLTDLFQNIKERSNRANLVDRTPLFANFEPIGIGQQAVATLWNGKLLGWLSIDNAVRHQPISKAHLDILALYALTAGSLLARKHAEFALRESETRYRLLAENIRDVIIKLQPDGTCSFVTPSCYYLTGHRPEDLTGRSIFELIHPDDVAVAQAILQKAVSSGTSFFTYTQRMRHKAGHYVWVEVTNTIVRDPQTGEVIEFVGLAHDITERQQAETALRKSEERFRQFIESAPLAALITDSDGIIILVNKEAENLFGYDRDELIGQTIDVLVPDDLKEAHEQHRYIYTLEPSRRHTEAIEVPALHKNGTIFPADVQLSFIDLEPSPMVMSFIIDITERKQAEQALKQALAQEKELGDLKSRFVSMASHEFRTPLAAILATTETLTLYRARMDAAQINARLDKIRQQVTHMQDIMEDVLRLARMQAGRIEFNPAEDDLHALCGEIIEEFESQTAFRGRILFKPSATPVIAVFDRRLLRQVITNVVHNALKYSDKQVDINLHQDDRQITLTVKDEGIGIPPEDMKRMFEPFHRATNVGTISGTGLGLSITEQAVKLHNGTITVESEVDVGTTLVVVIPNKLPSETV
jgi:PAS domain S-box-containing protein